MFGPHVDYLLLRPFCHARNRREREVAVAAAPWVPQLADFLEYFDGRLDLRGKAVLDVGCGGGEMAIEIAEAGAARVVGIDMVPKLIDAARARLAQRPELARRVEFVCADVHAWQPGEAFDVAISRAAFEHIEHPGAFLQRLGVLLRPGGVLATVFGPMFHSPFGDHLWGFFDVQIPYRGVLFNEQALLRLRREFYRPHEPVARWSDLSGGLNRLRYSEFVAACRDAGLEPVILRPNVTPRRRRALRLLAPISDALGRVPVLRDLIAHAPIALLRRPAAGAPTA